MKTDKKYVNGQPVSVQNGDMLTYFFKTGIVRARGKNVGETMEGKWIFNRESGALWQVGNFLNGKKHGKWVRYGENSEVEYDADFEDGKLIRKNK
jgi:antitoxin component YwqK of YwqJK toxin-antitoxin module